MFNDVLFSSVSSLAPWRRRVKLTRSESTVEREPPEVVSELSRGRPLDVSVMCDHILDQAAWRSDLKMPGTGSITVPPATALAASSPISPTARSQEVFSRRREGKNRSSVATATLTKKVAYLSYSGYEITGLIESDNMVVIPAAFTTPVSHRPAVQKAHAWTRHSTLPDLQT